MPPDKISLVVNRLLERSRNGEVEWVTTSDGARFSVSYSQYSVAIESDQSPPAFYQLSIFDQQGREIESLSIRPNDADYAKAEELYSLARQKGRRIVEALDNLLQEI